MPLRSWLGVLESVEQNLRVTDASKAIDTHL
jgi:hypothetical protein